MNSKTTENNDTIMICPRCTDEATKVCGGCKSISYCSTWCQQADWHSHKLLCKTFKDFQHRPSPDMRRVVAFLPGESKPRFMWVAEKQNDGVYADFDMEDLTDVGPLAFIKPVQTSTNAWTGKKLSQAIQVFYDDTFVLKYKEKNQAILNATQGMAGLGWRRPVVVCCGEDANSPYEKYLTRLNDMDLETYAHVVGFLVNFDNQPPKQTACKGPKVNCVRVACKGDQENGMPSHQVVSVPRSHPIFMGRGASSEISKVNPPFTSTTPMSPSLFFFRAAILTTHSQFVSMPLLTWKCPASQPSFKNQHITFMHIGCNPDIRSSDKPDRASFGFAPMTYQDGVGTQLVASATMKHLSADTVEAFGDFCQWHLMPYTQRYMEETDEEVAAADMVKARKKVMGQMTNAKWTEYFVQWKAEKEDASAAKARGARSYTLEKASSGLERMGLTEDDSDRLRSVLCSSLEEYLQWHKLRIGDE